MATAGLKAPPETPPTGQNREPDRPTIERVARSGFRCGDVEHDVAQRESEQEFRHQRWQHRWRQGCLGRKVSLQKDDGKRRDQASDNLGNPVGNQLGLRQSSAQRRREAHRRIKMAAGDVAASEDHDGSITVIPIVRIRKNVPIASTISFFISSASACRVPFAQRLLMERNNPFRAGPTNAVP
jgi:hypothetical protein